MLLLGLGVAGFAGTYVATALLGRHLYLMLRWLPLALAAVTVAMVACRPCAFGGRGRADCLGALNSALPVAWSTWLRQRVRDEPENGGGLIVAAIQLCIMLGAALGGMLWTACQLQQH